MTFPQVEGLSYPQEEDASVKINEVEAQVGPIQYKVMDIQRVND